MIIAVILIAFIAFSTGVFFPGDRVDILSTSEFMTAVQEDRVSEATYKAANGDINGRYWENSSDVSNKDKASKIRSSWVGTDNLAELMTEHRDKIDFKVDTSDGGLLEGLLLSLVPALIMVAVFIYFLNQLQSQNGQAMSFGKTKAKIPVDMRPKTKFSDVAGIDEAVEELQEIKDFLSNPERYRKMGAKIPRGVLLVGPPGTGKTLLAKAVAGEAGVPFFSISGSDFVEMFVGVGASRVRNLFKEAKEVSPSIVFIDEIDAVGRQRGAGLGGGHDEREQTLNQLLVEMDGFEEGSATILIAATNRPDILDPALLRPGRFDRQITVDRPDVKGREKILRVHAKGKPVNSSVEYESLAKLTPGFTGADLANLMNEAALLAARKQRKSISMSEIEEAMERVIAGPERKSRVMSESERVTIAYHESGHALVGHVLENADPVHKITIISRGQALGYTMSLPEEDHFLETRGRMFDELATLLAGRVAEELFCSDITTGASNDLERATKMARSMVTRYGMSEALGTQVFGEAQHQVFLGRDYADKENYSQDTAKRIDDEVSRIMQEARNRARSVLSDRAAQMHQMAAVLLERETIDGKALESLLGDRWEAYLVEEAAEKQQRKQRAAAALARRRAREQAARQAAATHAAVQQGAGQTALPQQARLQQAPSQGDSAGAANK
ncbi:MAG: ATP-dependent zinc metalloprotease FtsH [Atopobiaceae bacterium]|nr:ATP-dependent zinc metalloprotease FtsH [Atopobiaceae bacterium]